MFSVSNIQTDTPPIVLLLAAGLSRRMGDENKLLLRHKGRPLIWHSAAFFRRHFSKVFIVTGFEAQRIKSCCAGLDVNFIHNPDYEQGLGQSFKRGLKGLPAVNAPLLTALADQIFLTPEDLDKITAAYHEQAGRKVIIPQYEGRRGHPVLFPPRAVKLMRAAQPPMTGREFIEAYPHDSHFIVMPQPNCVLDIDTPTDARQHLRPDDVSHDR